MNKDKEVLLKSLHVCLGIPILVFDENYILIEEYKSNRTVSFFYDFQKFLKEATKKNSKFHYINGNYNELFLLYAHNKKFFLFGPFRCNAIDKNMFNSIVQYKNIKNSEKEFLYELLNKLPIFSLGDIRDILILVHYFFTGKIEDLFHKPLHDYVNSFSKVIQVERIDALLSQNYDPEVYLFLYENKILEYVENGNVKELSDMIFKLSNGVVPAVSGDSVRSEKNYSIVVFEKLAQTAINMGMDLINAYQSRNSFIRENELCSNLKEILQIRDTAIVFYTSEIGKAKVRHLSPQISSVVQYIGLNMYTKISVRQIAQYFSMSEASLRTAFKREMNISIHNYILRRKISESKVMLKSNSTISDVALSLGFSDASHFSKVFKKITGTSPKKYQMSVESKITLNLG
ncbi:YSIRK-targeted surface antigen transcriptional regulator [Enterococcus faecalis]|uniref:YSIRK-targeted surface antigen transcriptional regulator n=1 Tax=Enterococcus faecalis TaxID=1351 RepID=UPI000D681C7A|nr:YSIRK-targeted surface antigen transcriptional regulator [Enterococcus faecalis]PWI82969.1 YSIRK-targeted surface antigen transcriptional regulator [Enterococcus faecalis]PWI85193.1 YSIRK-targeted surface antigen transcriptional regulator [Enterococcus faecalis]PWI87903.1 YSIRK-targeted surface antigen transcriptional regulator [Enterococcus faecalis]